MGRREDPAPFFASGTQPPRRPRYEDAADVVTRRMPKMSPPTAVRSSLAVMSPARRTPIQAAAQAQSPAFFCTRSGKTMPSRHTAW